MSEKNSLYKVSRNFSLSKPKISFPAIIINDYASISSQAKLVRARNSYKFKSIDRKFEGTARVFMMKNLKFNFPIEFYRGDVNAVIVRQDLMEEIQGAGYQSNINSATILYNEEIISQDYLVIAPITLALVEGVSKFSNDLKTFTDDKNQKWVYRDSEEYNVRIFSIEELYQHLLRNPFVYILGGPFGFCCSGALANAVLKIPEVVRKKIL